MFAKLLFIELSKIPNFTLAVIAALVANVVFNYVKTTYTLLLQSALFAIALIEGLSHLIIASSGHQLSAASSEGVKYIPIEV